MTTSFHATLARIAAYRATMLVEPLLGCPLGIDAHDVLAHNIQVGHPESAMTIADALVRSYDPTGQVFRGYSYDRVMDEVPAAVIERSARRALAVVPFGAVLEGRQVDALRGAIAVELTYLWLRATERFYVDLAGDHPTDESDATGQEHDAVAVGTVRRINPMDCEAVVDLKPLLNGHLPVDVGDRLYASSQDAQPALRRLAAALRWCRNSLGHHFHPELRDAVENALSSDGAEQPGAWRWTAKGDSEPFLRLSGAPMHVGGDVVAVKPLFA